MIYSHNGKIRIKGDATEIKADLSLIVHELHENVFTQEMTKEEAKEEIMDAVEMGFMSMNEMTKLALEEVMKLLKDLTDSLDEDKGEE